MLFFSEKIYVLKKMGVLILIFFTKNAVRS
jgi:hypothetical protein